MTTALQRALINTKQIEGGYTIINGHETYCGIDRVYWPEWSGWGIVDDCTAGMISEDERDSALTDEVDSFYRVNFWNRVRGDEVARLSESVAVELFDTAVNLDVPDAVRFLQIALNIQNFQGTYPDLATDGKIGAKTLQALARYLDRSGSSRADNEAILLNCMNGEQYIHYKANPQHRKFRGWFRRV